MHYLVPGPALKAKSLISAISHQFLEKPLFWLWLNVMSLRYKLRDEELVPVHVITIVNILN